MTELFAELDSLLQDDYDAEFVLPTEYAVGEAKRSLEAVNVPGYRAATDGCGNVRLEWKKTTKEISATLKRIPYRHQFSH